MIENFGQAAYIAFLYYDSLYENNCGNLELIFYCDLKLLYTKVSPFNLDLKPISKFNIYVISGTAFTT